MVINGNTLVQGSFAPSSFSGIPVDNANVGISFKIVALPTVSRIDITIRRQDLPSTGNSLASRLTANVGKVIKLIAGVATVSGINITLAVGDVIELRADFSTIEVLKNGAVVDAVTNSELILTGLAGLTKNTSIAFGLMSWRSFSSPKNAMVFCNDDSAAEQRGPAYSPKDRCPAD